MVDRTVVRRCLTVAECRCVPPDLAEVANPLERKNVDPAVMCAAAMVLWHAVVVLPLCVCCSVLWCPG